VPDVRDNYPTAEQLFKQNRQFEFAIKRLTNIAAMFVGKDAAGQIEEPRGPRVHGQREYMSDFLLRKYNGLYKFCRTRISTTMPDPTNKQFHELSHELKQWFYDALTTRF
jgi:hypothetical protein